MFSTTGAYATRIVSETTVFSAAGVDDLFSDVERPQPASMNEIATSKIKKQIICIFFMGENYTVCGTVVLMRLSAIDESKFEIVNFMSQATIRGKKENASNPPHLKSQV